MAFVWEADPSSAGFNRTARHNHFVCWMFWSLKVIALSPVKRIVLTLSYCTLSSCEQYWSGICLTISAYSSPALPTRVKLISCYVEFEPGNNKTQPPAEAVNEHKRVAQRSETNAYALWGSVQSDLITCRVGWNLRRKSPASPQWLG